MRRPLSIEIDTTMDYDAAYMQNRIHSKILIEGEAVGPFAMMRVDSDRIRNTEDIRSACEMVERRAVQEFVSHLQAALR